MYLDKKNLVRTLKVGYRKWDKRESSDVYWKKPLTEQIVSVQRLAILQAVGEPLPTGGQADELPLDVNARVAHFRIVTGTF